MDWNVIISIIGSAIIAIIASVGTHYLWLNKFSIQSKQERFIKNGFDIVISTIEKFYTAHCHYLRRCCEVLKTFQHQELNFDLNKLSEGFLSSVNENIPYDAINCVNKVTCSNIVEVCYNSLSIYLTNSISLTKQKIPDNIKIIIGKKEKNKINIYVQQQMNVLTKIENESEKDYRYFIKLMRHISVLYEENPNKINKMYKHREVSESLNRLYRYFSTKE